MAPLNTSSKNQKTIQNQGQNPLVPGIKHSGPLQYKHLITLYLVPKPLQGPRIQRFIRHNHNLPKRPKLGWDRDREHRDSMPRPHFSFSAPRLLEIGLACPSHAHRRSRALFGGEDGKIFPRPWLPFALGYLCSN